MRHTDVGLCFISEEDSSIEFTSFLRGVKDKSLSFRPLSHPIRIEKALLLRFQTAFEENQKAQKARPQKFPVDRQKRH